MVNGFRVLRPLDWFLLVWLAVIYLWALFGAVLHESEHAVAQLATFTALMVLIGTLLWRSVSMLWSRTTYFVYPLAQAALVFAVGLVTHQASVVFALYVSLTLGMLAAGARVRHVIQVAGVYVALVLFSVFFDAVLDPFDPATFWMGLTKGAANWPDFWALFWTGSDYPALIAFAGGFLLLYWQQARGHERLEAAHAALRASTARIEELTRFTERQRLARELHDTLAQGVSGIIMQLEAANAHLRQKRLALAEDILQQTMATARATLADARSAIDDLRTLSSHELFAERVWEEIEHFQLATGIPCEADLPALSIVPPALVEHAFWTIREGLTNVARHARARQVLVRMVEIDDGEGLAIDVHDDGAGFDPNAKITQSGHYGLMGLGERARLTGGTLEIVSAPGEGCTIRLCLPLAVDEGEESDR